MTAMSRSGCDPNLAVWEDPNTLLDSITSTLSKDKETGEQFKMYIASQPRLKGNHGVKRLAYVGKKNACEASLPTPDIDDRQMPMLTSICSVLSTNVFLALHPESEHIYLWYYLRCKMRRSLSSQENVFGMSAPNCCCRKGLRR